MSAKRHRLAKVVRAVGHGKAVLESTDNGYYVVECSDPRELRTNSVFGGPLDDCHEPAIEVRVLGRPHGFKLSVLSWAPTLQQALENA